MIHSITSRRVLRHYERDLRQESPRESGPRYVEFRQLFAPARKYQLDLAEIDERNLPLDNDVAESSQLRRQLFGFDRQGIKFDVRRDNGPTEQRSVAYYELSWTIDG